MLLVHAYCIVPFLGAAGAGTVIIIHGLASDEEACCGAVAAGTSVNLLALLGHES